jgi:hypothetical protein
MQSTNKLRFVCLSSLTFLLQLEVIIRVGLIIK